MALRKANWLPVQSTLNYQEPKAKLVAVYKYTHQSGYACYYVFDVADTTQRPKNAKSMGGLPVFVGERCLGGGGK